MDWLTQNREWVFSGAGLFAISTIASLLSVVFTLWWKARTERKRKKKLRVAQTVTQFTVPEEKGSGSVAPEHFKVSYKGIEYENLSAFYVSLMNVGLPAIERQQLHIVLPANANVVERFEEKSLDSIGVSKREKVGNDKIEEIYTFDRLEPNDTYGITYLIDLSDISALRYEMRGVDDIEYVKSGEIERSEMQKLIELVALFLLVGSIPFAGGVAQAAIVLAGAPLILELYRKTFGQARVPENSVSITGGIHITQDGVLQISQSPRNKT